MKVLFLTFIFFFQFLLNFGRKKINVSNVFTLSFFQGSGMKYLREKRSSTLVAKYKYPRKSWAVPQVIMQVDEDKAQECLEKGFQCKPKAAQCASAFSSEREGGEGQMFLLWMDTCNLYSGDNYFKSYFCLPFPTQLASNSCSFPHHSQEPWQWDVFLEVLRISLLYTEVWNYCFKMME